MDCRFDLDDPDWGRQQYLAGHVRGAVYAHLERDLSGRPDGVNGRHPLPPISQLTEVFSRWGIDDRTRVVAYDASGGPFAARLWWLLRYLGHEEVIVLDGGLPAWKRAGYPLAAGPVTVETTAFVPAPQEDMLATAATVLASLEDPAVRLIDARAPQRYEGELEPRDPVAGRIPGAANRFWQDNLNPDLEFLPSEDLRRTFLDRLGGLDPRRAISYCGSGVTAAHNALAMAAAGLPLARVFVGSWSEWCADPQRPIARGPSEAGGSSRTEGMGG